MAVAVILVDGEARFADDVAELIDILVVHARLIATNREKDTKIIATKRHKKTQKGFWTEARRSSDTSSGAGLIVTNREKRHQKIDSLIPQFLCLLVPFCGWTYLRSVRLWTLDF